MKYIMISLLICCLPFYAMAEEKITEIHFVSEAWEEATNEDGTGFYWDLFRLIYEPVGIKVQFETLPYMRCVKLIQGQKADALVGAYIGEIGGPLYPKYHFDADQVAAVFLKSKNIQWQGQKTLEGKRVGWIRGYSYDDYLTPFVEKYELDTRRNGLQMLLRDRIDFFLDAVTDIEYELSEDYFKDQVQDFQMEHALELKLYLAFANTDRGQALMQIFDERMEALIDSGELKQLYEEADYTDYPFE